jgi:hypothetical protein
MPNRIEAARTDCLMQGMADKLGVNPAVAVTAGRLEAAELDGMVARCRSCTHSDDCILWMVDHSTGADAAPGYCLNSEELDMLRR